MSSHTFGRYGLALVVSGLLLAGAAITMRANAVQLPSHPIAISSGPEHACALFSAGSVKCWGNNSKGQSGLSYINMFSTNLPVLVQLNGPAKAISSGFDFNCALLTSGEVQCWGGNFFGQAGAPNSDAFPIATPVPLAGPAIALASGQGHSCAIVQILNSTVVQCWGENSQGQLGNNQVANFSQTPQIVQGANGAKSLALGSAHSCALTQEGVICWGGNEVGQLGRGNTSESELPGFALSLVNYSSIASGRSGRATCGFNSGTAYCWGTNDGGTLGVGSLLPSQSVTPVPGLNSISSITFTDDTDNLMGCMIDSKKVYCAGRSIFGPMDNFVSNTPIQMLSTPSQVTGMAISSRFACFIVPQGLFNSSVQCMGEGTDGQLGNGKNLQSSSPVTVKF